MQRVAVGFAGERCDRERGVQYNVRDIGVRIVYDDSVKVELVAPLPGLFFLRCIDSGDARYNLQRINIMVREAGYRDSCYDIVSHESLRISYKEVIFFYI